MPVPRAADYSVTAANAVQCIRTATRDHSVLRVTDSSDTSLSADVTDFNGAATYSCHRACCFAAYMTQMSCRTVRDIGLQTFVRGFTDLIHVGFMILCTGEYFVHSPFLAGAKSIVF